MMISKIGSGGYGEVWVAAPKSAPASSSSSNGLVAIKVGANGKHTAITDEIAVIRAISRPQDRYWSALLDEGVLLNRTEYAMVREKWRCIESDDS